MIRSELCAIADIAPGTFNSHRRNGDLPFGGPAAVETPKGGWGRFSLADAMLLIATRQLVADQGLSWSQAAAMLRDRSNSILVGTVNGRISTPYDNPGHFWATVSFAHVSGDAPPSYILAAKKGLAGPLTAIIEAANRMAEWATKEAAQGLYASLGPIVITSIAAVNLSHCWQIAHKRAEQLGIDLSADPIEPEGDE